MAFEKVFPCDGEAFTAVSAARHWLEKHGFSIGSMCGAEPMGLLKGNHAIAKWRNLTPKERSQLDGQLYGRRTGDARVLLKENPKIAEPADA